MDVVNATHALMSALVTAAQNQSGEPDGVVMKLSSSTHQEHTGVGSGVYAAFYFDVVAGQDNLTGPKFALADPVSAANLKRIALNYSMYGLDDDGILLERHAESLVWVWLKHIQPSDAPAQ